MRARARPSLVVRLVAVTVAAGIVAGFVGALLVRNASRDALRREIQSRNTLLAEELAGRLDTGVRSALETLRLVASRREIASLGPGLADELRTVIRVTPMFDELAVYDAAGRPAGAAAARYLPDPNALAARPGLGAVPSGGRLRVVDSFPPLLELATPVEHPPGTRSGVLVASVPLEVLAVGIQQAPPPAAPQRFFVDAAGRMLVHADRDRVARGERFTLPQPPEPLMSTTLVVDGHPQLVAVARTDVLEGAVVLQQSEAAALAPVATRVRELVIIVIIVVGVAVFAVIVAGTRLLRPLHGLTTAVNRLGRGERDVRVPPVGGGEVLVLAEEFNRLAGALARRDDELRELQNVSLFVNSLARREELLTEIVQGGRTLMRARSCSVFLEDDHGALAAFASSDGRGAHPEHAATAQTTVRIGRLHVRQQNGSSVVGVPIATLDGRFVGAVVADRAMDFADDELGTIAAFASVAGVALENVQRLELQQSLTEELQRAVDRRRDLIGTVTHEFRTPLTCIEGFSSGLFERWDAIPEPERRELVAKIHHHSEELSELVGRLLDFAVSERGSLRAEPGPVDLRAAVDDALRALSPILEGRPVTADVPEAVVEADAVLLRRTISNLLANAVKYSPPGSPVRVRAVEDGAQVRIEVIDEGVGLSADETARVFDPFWRAGNPSTRGARGAGIGLSLVSEYVRVMGGRADVVSEPGRGSTFSFTLRRWVEPTAEYSAFDGAADRDSHR